MDATGSTAEDFYGAVFVLFHNDIAGQHHPDFIFSLKCFICEVWITGSQYFVFLEIYIQLLLERIFDIYFRQHAKGLFPQFSSYAFMASSKP